MRDIEGKMNNIFTKHTHAINETYWQHLGFAIKNAVKLFCISLVLLIHGIFPFIFQDTTRNFITRLADRLSKRHPHQEG